MKKAIVMGTAVWMMFFVQLCFGSTDAENDIPMDIILVLDNSGSMKTNDPMSLTRVVTTDFVENLNSDSRLGLVIFDQSARLSIPLQDISKGEAKSSFLEALKRVDYKGLYTDSPAAIEKALYELKTNGREDVKRLIIFLTDGIVDTGNKNEDIEKAKWLKEDLALEIKNHGIKVFGIAFTEDADFHLIQSLAVKTEGEYFKATLAEDIQPVFDKINEIILKPAEEKQITEELEQKRSAISNEMVVDPQASRPDKAEPFQEQLPVAAEPQKQVPSQLFITAGVILLGSILILVVFLNKSKKQRSHQKVIPKAHLLDKKSAVLEKPFTIQSKITRIGRGAVNDVQISEDTVSNEHALIEYDANTGYFNLEDLDSSNGTLLNGNKIAPHIKHKLKHGSSITIDSFDFHFTFPGQAVQGDDDKTVLVKNKKNNSAVGNVEGTGRVDSSREESFGDISNKTVCKPGMCPNHQTIRATEMCYVCKKAFCKTCVTEKDGKYICQSCLENAG